MPNEPKGWPKYNEIVYPPLKEGQPLRPAVGSQCINSSVCLTYVSLGMRCNCDDCLCAILCIITTKRVQSFVMVVVCPSPVNSVHVQSRLQ